MKASSSEAVTPGAASTWPGRSVSGVRTSTLAQQRRGYAQALPHAEGETAGPRARDLRQPGQLDYLVHPAAPDAGRPGQRQQVVAGRQSRVHGPGVQQDAEFRHRGGRLGVALAVDAHRPTSRPVQPGDHPHRGGFARTVRAEESGDHAGFHHEAQPVDGDLVPVPFGQAINFDHVASLQRSLRMKGTLRTAPPGAIYPRTRPFRPPMPAGIGPGAGTGAGEQPSAPSRTTGSTSTTASQASR
jgi:hypothetical protein